MKLTPIALFTYNRPQHTKQVLNSLAQNKEAQESTLYIYCDGAKENASYDTQQKIKEVREIISTENRFEKIIIRNSPENLGLAKSIIKGVSEVINTHGKVIVLEDDIIVSRYFLHFMNDSLQRYENEPSVGQIGCCNFFACGKKYPDTFFINMPDCWGWATWKNRWESFNTDAKFLLNELESKNLMHKFNVYGASNMQSMLQLQIQDKVNSWAIRWTAVCILNNWLTLYPNPSMSQHIASENATHANTSCTPPLCNTLIKYKTIPIEESDKVNRAMIKGYSGTGNYYGQYIFNKNTIKKILIKIKSKFL